MDDRSYQDSQSPSGAGVMASQSIGVVAIGRNEGGRLRACLESARRDCAAVVYVDSGSTDGSVELAKSLGVNVVNLDLSKPFTAARARNEGYARLREIAPAIDAVQFVDGDCEIVAGWIDSARAMLASDPKIAIVCGRRRERFPRASIYNRLCDMEWNTPIGVAIACGGDALIRSLAFDQVNGYDPAIIAGEEPEMCVRLRQLGWTIHRINAEMTLHDAAMTRFGQWWKRSLRSGHAYAQGYFLHGRKESSRDTAPRPVPATADQQQSSTSDTPSMGPGAVSRERFRKREVRSIEKWATGPILLTLAGVFVLSAVTPKACYLGALPLLLYPVLAVRIALSRLRRHLAGESTGDALLYGTFVVLGKFPQWLGICRFRSAHRRGEQVALIEYKDPAGLHGGNRPG